MISDNVRNLFKFIEFLHENIDNFNQYNITVLEWKKAADGIISFPTHYTQKLNNEKLEKTAKEKIEILSKNILKPIMDEDKRLGVSIVANDEDKMPDNSFINSFSNSYLKYRDEAYNLINTFDKNDIGVIHKAKNQYLSFRNNVNSNIFNIPGLTLFFGYIDCSMSIINEYFNEEGDKLIPEYKELSYKDIVRKPMSFNLQIPFDKVKDLFYILIKQYCEVIQKKTDLAHFAYAINGNEIPLDKLPYKPVRLVNTVDSMYRELLTFMKNNDILPEDAKTIPKKYRNLAEHLFLNSRGGPLKLRTPK